MQQQGLLGLTRERNERGTQGKDGCAEVRKERNKGKNESNFLSCDFFYPIFGFHPFLVALGTAKKEQSEQNGPTHQKNKNNNRTRKKEFVKRDPDLEVIGCCENSLHTTLIAVSLDVV